ncbi:hypothetical protein PG988_003739 [Apiospora saccharicola]
MATLKWKQMLGSIIACTTLSIGITQAVSPRSDPPGTLSLPIRYNADNHWYCSIWLSAEIGEPPQPIDFGVVTNDYITTPYSGICPSNTWACRYGSYDPTKSSSQQIIANGEVDNGRFVDLYNDEGDMFRETVAFGGAKVANLTIGLELHGSLPTLNLGAMMDMAGKPTLSTMMADQDIIVTNAYTLALDRKAGFAEGNGTLTFGAIDTKKFAGDLVILEASDFAQDKRRSTDLGIALTSLKVGSSTGEDELLAPEAPLFISPEVGNDMMVLPTSLVRMIFDEIGDVDSNFDNDENPTVPCEKADPDAYLSFQFHGPSGPLIKVSLADYFVPLNYTPGLPKKGPDYHPRRHSSARCTLMILRNINPAGPTSMNWLVELGETFLRNAYMVYDFENRQVGMAQAHFSTASDIVPFASRGAKIPSPTPGPAVKHPRKYNVSTQTFSDFPVAKLDVLHASPGIQRSSLGQYEGRQKNLAIGLGVGLSLGLVAILGGVVCLWVFRLGRPVPFFGKRLGKPSTKDRSELEAKEQGRECPDTASASSSSEPTRPVSPAELDASTPTKSTTRGPEPHVASVASDEA